MRVPRLIILAFTVLIYSSLYSQGYLSPELLSVEDGLSSRQVNCLLPDDQGYLWAGTMRGLNRYNGYRFKQFFTSAGTNILPGSQHIHAVKCGTGGNIWILTDAGVSLYNGRTGNIRQYPVSSLDAVFIPGSQMTDISAAPDGSLWLLTDRSLTVLSPEEVVNTYLIPEGMLPNGTKPTSVTADAIGNIWIGTTRGLLLFSSQQKAFRELAAGSGQGLLSNSQVNCLFIGHDNYIWVGTGNGLNRVDPVDLTFSHFYPAGTPGIQPLNNVVDVSGAETGSLVLATGAGLVSFDPADDFFENIYVTNEHAFSAVAVDSTGIIWGATNQGIVKIRRAKLTVRNVVAKAGTTGLQDSHIKVIGRGLGNEIFIGYEKGGFSVLDARTIAGSFFKTIDGSAVVQFSHFRQQDYLVLTEHDIEIYRPGSSARMSLFSRYSFLRKELVEKTRLNCFYYDNENVLWLGTSDGLQQVRFDSSKHTARQSLVYQGQQSRIGAVYAIGEDPLGNIWLGTEEGLVFYNPVKGNYNRYTPYDVNLLNTERKAVYCLLRDKGGIFWLGTSGGAYRFDADTREFTAVTEDPNLMSSSVQALALDGYSNLWIGTENGLYYYLRNSGKVKLYDLKDGLLNDFHTAIAADPVNRLFLAGPNGLSVVTLADTVPSARIPQVAITAIRYIDNNPASQELYHQVPDTIVLPWKRRPLQVEFAVLDFSRPGNNQFRYRFGKPGRDLPWNHLGTQNSVTLDKLVPGKYLLNVTGANADQVWNNSGQTLIIVVEAPYWRSKIGLAVITLVSLFLIFIFLRFWVRQFFNLSRENQERETYARQIMSQKEELTLKNKAITDSINYAKRIQTAMLPPYKLFKSIFPSSFILFMPKDIVSGDFYWIHKVGSKIFIAAVDCTGHGVPGAFMSIIGFELFRKITNIEGLTRPSDILNRLNDDFHEIFKDVDNVVLRDGMDVAFCSIDKKDMILEFAGAFNPLYLIRDNKITEIKGDRFAIGLDETNFKEQTFKNHIIPLQKNDIFYIFSDGFADQFGGPDGKKYKYRRFRHLLLNLHQLPMEKQHEILENNVMEWRGEQDQVDDILVIGVKVDF